METQTRRRPTPNSLIRFARFAGAGIALFVLLAGCSDNESAQRDPKTLIEIEFTESADTRSRRDISDEINRNRNTPTEVTVYRGTVDDISRPIVVDGELYEVSCDEDQFIDLYPLEEFDPPTEQTQQVHVTVDRRLCGLVDGSNNPVAFYS